MKNILLTFPPQRSQQCLRLGLGRPFRRMFPPTGVFLKMLVSGRACMTKRSADSRRAFTLIELLTVVAIIVVLAALLYPAIQRMGSNRLQAKCTANLKNIHASWSCYVADNDGRLPPASTGAGPWYQDYWTKSLFPYLGFSSAPAGHLNALVNTVAFCPANNGNPYHRQQYSALSYLPNALIGGAYNSTGQMQGALTTWPSSRVNVATTVGAIEQPASRMLFACAREGIVRTFLNADNVEPYLSKSHGGGGNILYADGHVAIFYPDSTKPGEAIALVLGPGK